MQRQGYSGHMAITVVEVAADIEEALYGPIMFEPVITAMDILEANCREALKLQAGWMVDRLHIVYPPSFISAHQRFGIYPGVASRLSAT